MATPAQTCARLIAALEDLAAQEAAALETQDFEAANTIQDRAAPVVDQIVQYGAEILRDRSLSKRLVEIHALRDRSAQSLARQMDYIRSELQETNAATRRVAQVAPAYGYGKQAVVRSHLAAVG